MNNQSVKTRGQFIALEFSVYLSQIFMFFVAAVLSSRMLSDEAALIKFMESKIHEGSTAEAGYILLATLFTLGVFSALAAFLRNTLWLDALSKTVLKEIPRTIYFFGSSVSGTVLAAALFVARNPGVEAPTPKAWISIMLIFSIGAFLYGCGISYGLNRKSFE